MLRNGMVLLALVLVIALMAGPTRFLMADDKPPSPADDGSVLFDGDDGKAADPMIGAAAKEIDMDGSLDGDLTSSIAAGDERGKHLGELVAKFDKDKDGKLSDEEKAAAKEAMKAQADEWLKKRFTKEADKNGDGKLDDAEKAALDDMLAKHHAKVAEIKAKIVKKFDANGDGKLDDGERAKLREIAMKRFKHGPGKGEHPKGEHPKKGHGDGDKGDEGKDEGKGDK